MSQPVTDAITAQGSLKPGDEGWWPVWGARWADVKKGDLVLVKPKNGEAQEHQVVSLIHAGGMDETIYFRFLNQDGKDVGFGRMCPVKVWRQGTCNVLADSVRLRTDRLPIVA